MFTYKIIKTEILENPLYATYTFNLIYNSNILSTNTIYNILISEQENVFNKLTQNIDF